MWLHIWCINTVYILERDKGINIFLTMTWSLKVCKNFLGCLGSDIQPCTGLPVSMQSMKPAWDFHLHPHAGILSLKNKHQNNKSTHIKAWISCKPVYFCTPTFWNITEKGANNFVLHVYFTIYNLHTVIFTLQVYSLLFSIFSQTVQPLLIPEHCVWLFY